MQEQHRIAKLLGVLTDMAGHTSIGAEILNNVSESIVSSGATVCSLESLAANLQCDANMTAIVEAVRDLVNRPTPPYAAWYCAKVAQALNWERTEFDTLDELLEGLREMKWARRKFSDEVSELYNRLAGFADNLPAGKSKDELYSILKISPRSATTHTLLHAGELYRDVTILLQTSQLVAWRDADGQEHCERAHRVTLNPDRDGLAAAILSGIAGAQIAPEHIAELRAQMGGGIHG